MPVYRTGNNIYTVTTWGAEVHSWVLNTAGYVFGNMAGGVALADQSFDALCIEGADHFDAFWTLHLIEDLTVYHDRSGTGTAVGAGDGSRSILRNRSGNGTAVGAGGASRSVLWNRSGQGTAIGAGGASRSLLRNRSGAGVAIGTGHGSRSVAHSRSGAGVAAGTGDGSRSVAFDRSGSGVAVAGGDGSQVVEITRRTRRVVRSYDRRRDELESAQVGLL